MGIELALKRALKACPKRSEGRLRRHFSVILSQSSHDLTAISEGQVFDNPSLEAVMQLSPPRPIIRC